MIQSCIVYKEKSSRIRLFARFLSVYDELSNQDLKLYCDVTENLHKLVLNFAINDADEKPLIPLPRALDCFKQLFATRLST